MLTLTGNDIALARMAVAMEISRLKKGETARRKFTRARIAELDALSRKLGQIHSEAYPYVPPKHEDEPLPDGYDGDDPIMKMDMAVVRKTRAAILKAAKNAA